MIKFTEYEVTFREIPDEITLAVNISNCQNNCPGCHSSYLKENIGKELTEIVVDEIIEKNNGITCFCFMGEGNDTESLKKLILYIKEKHPKIKIGLYSGRNTVNEDFYWENLDYLKIGPYVAELGPLDKETTNQRLYKRYGDDVRTFEIVNGVLRSHWSDITEKFWKKSLL